MAELLDTPMLIVHVSAPEATNHIRNAQTRLLPLYGETCPHYALLTADKMHAPGFEGRSLPRFFCSRSVFPALAY